MSEPKKSLKDVVKVAGTPWPYADVMSQAEWDRESEEFSEEAFGYKESQDPMPFTVGWQIYLSGMMGRAAAITRKRADKQFAKLDARLKEIEGVDERMLAHRSVVAELEARVLTQASQLRELQAEVTILKMVAKRREAA